MPSSSIIPGSTSNVAAMAGSTETPLAHAEDVKVLGSSAKLNATERRDEPRT